MKIISTLLIAFAGGLVAVLLYRSLEVSRPDSPISFKNPLVRNASYDLHRSDSINNVFSVGFGDAAAITLEQVVHIRSRVIVPQRDIYREFFGEGFWEQFFRQNSWLRPVQNARESSGSGVIFSANGYIITNNHVVANAQDVRVSLYNGRSYDARIIATDPSTDLAVLKIDATGLPEATIANSDNVRVGDWVLAVGNPFNLASTVTAGIVSAKARNIHILNDNSAVESFIQTDAAVNPGNSGGALVNLSGELIGINTAIATPTGTFAGYAFSVPSNIVKKVVDDLIRYGEVRRGYLGIAIRDLDWDLAREMGLKDIAQGVVVEQLIEGGAAAVAGLKRRDIILEIDNVPVRSTAQLLETVARHEPGDTLPVTIYRNGDRQVVNVKLQKAPKARRAMENAMP